MKRHFEGITGAVIVGWLRDGKLSDLDSEIRQTLTDFFTLPPVDQRTDPRDTDLALDVILESYQQGEFVPVSIGHTILPIGWRPKVTMVARLFHIDSNRTIGTYKVAQPLPWRTYLARVVLKPDLSILIRDTETFTVQDVQALFYKAAIRLLKDIQSDAV